MAFVSKSVSTCCGIAATFIFVACGGARTPMLPPTCEIKVVPTALDFGSVLPGEAATKQVRIIDIGGAECILSSIALGPATDAWFGLSGPSEVTVQPGASALVNVSFQPAKASIPLTRTGELTFNASSETRGYVALPLTAKIQSDCKLDVSPTALDFGHVALDNTATRTVQLVNRGTGPCEIQDIAIGPGSDSQFHLDSPNAFALEPGEQQSLEVSFHAVDPATPHHRTGTLVFGSNDPAKAKGNVPLSADIDIGCDLSWLPSSVDFGNVMLNTKANGHVSLANDGSDTCYVSDIAITPDSEPNFRLTSQASIAVAPGAIASIDLTFTAADSSPPHLKTGTLVFETGNKRTPTAKVPLSANVDTVCVEASRWIYTVDDNSLLSRFDPDTLTFTDIARLRCPTSESPNSMAVDQNAVAWVAYHGGNMFKVNTTTGACEASGFQTQYGLKEFGMGFVFDPTTGQDTLYIAGGDSMSGTQSTLATVSFPQLVVTPIGAVYAGLPEMTGTGDGQLWGFVPAGSSSSGLSALIRIDTNSGKTLDIYQYSYQTLPDGYSWAMKFWGGYFWIFLDTSVYRVDRNKPSVADPVTVHGNHGYIVGAGVSTCAPVQ
jgi:hypothetical protein